MKRKKSNIFKYIHRYSYLCMGLFLYSTAFNLFMLPNNFVVGGVSGISIILYKFFSFDTSLTVSILSIFLLILGFIFCNRDRVYSSVASTFILPLFIKLTSGITNYIELDVSPLLACLYCALLVGVALGLVYKVGFSTGGTDIFYWILERYIKKSTGQLMLIVEGTIVSIGAIIFGFQKLMYSLIILFIMSKVSDKIVIGISDSKLVCIIPKKPDEVKECLNGLSFIKSLIIRNEEDKNIIYCIVPTRDYLIFYNQIKIIDKEVFLSVNNTYETIGGKV